MRRIILTATLGLDGRVQAAYQPDAAWWSDDVVAFMRRETRDAAGLLLGRRTWEALTAGDAPPTAWVAPAQARQLPWFVVSASGDRAGWWPHTTVLPDLATVARLRAGGDGEDIHIHGGVSLARSLMAANLVDEYRFLMVPQLRGDGPRLLDLDRLAGRLLLTTCERFPTGVTALTWSPADDAIPSLDAPGRVAIPA
jgi:dihydrofolate reductase